MPRMCTQMASLPELGPGGSWSTCMMGCHTDPPRDVAHVQFKSRIAFKLVWCPPEFKSFVLVDDDGALLAAGTPTGNLPSAYYRQNNFEMTRGGKYSTVASEYNSKDVPPRDTRRRPVPDRELIGHAPMTMSTITTRIQNTKLCSKCGTFPKSGRVSCCAPGGAWSTTCGRPASRNVYHSWLEGMEACKRKYGACSIG